MPKLIDLENAAFEALDARRAKTVIAFDEAAVAIIATRGEKITVGEIEGGLVEVLGLEQITDILYGRDVDSAQIIALLANYDFARLKPEKLCEVLLPESESFFPYDIPILLTEAYVKVRGEKWVVNKNDADPFPSNPHAHNYDQGLKLHLGNGELYQTQGVLQADGKKGPCKIAEIGGGEERNHRIAAASDLASGHFALPAVLVADPACGVWR